MLHGRLSVRDRVATSAALIPLLSYGIDGNYEAPDVPRLLTLLVSALCLAGAVGARRWAAFAVLGWALALGVFLRLQTHPFNGSDVMLATNEAVQNFLEAGVFPYSYVLTSTNPPGQPFAYPPGEFLFYALGKLVTGSVFGIDRLCGIGNLLAIAALFPIAGPALCALAVTFAALNGQLAFAASAGSNDTAASFIVVVAIVLLAWSERVRRPRWWQVLWWGSAIAFAWAITFKETTALVYLGVLLWLYRDGRNWRSHAAKTFYFATLITLPFVLRDPLGFWHNVAGALVAHANIWGRNVWMLLTVAAPGASEGVAPFIPLVLAAALVAVGWLCWKVPARTLGGAVLQGCALLGTLFLFARWTTVVYYVQAAPILLSGLILALGAAEKPEGSPAPGATTARQ